jgi:hypothetical protein
MQKVRGNFKVDGPWAHDCNCCSALCVYACLCASTCVRVHLLKFLVIRGIVHLLPISIEDCIGETSQLQIFSPFWCFKWQLSDDWQGPTSCRNWHCFLPLYILSHKQKTTRREKKERPDNLAVESILDKLPPCRTHACGLTKTLSGSTRTHLMIFRVVLSTTSTNSVSRARDGKGWSHGIVQD